MPEQWPGQRRVTGRDDLARILADLDISQRAGTDTLARTVQTGDQAELIPDASRLLPVLPELVGVLPWPGGLLKGATVAAVGSSSLRLALLAGGMSQGGWAAVVGQPWFGALAADDYRIPLDRLALIPEPGPEWPRVVAALTDGMAMIVVTAPDPGDQTVRSLQARARERGCVLIPTRPWAGADLVLERTSQRWTGLGQGRGRLRRQHATFRVTGRGRAAREKTLEMMFPPESIAGPEPQPIYLPPAPERIPPRGGIPENRQPTRAAAENPLWTNLRPNKPPAGLDRL